MSRAIDGPREALATMKEFDRNNANNIGWFQILGQFEYPRAAEIGQSSRASMPAYLGESPRTARGDIASRSVSSQALCAREPSVQVDRGSPLPGHGAREDGASDRGPPTSRRRAEEAGGPRADVLGWPADSGEQFDYGWTEWVSATILRNEDRGADRLRPDIPPRPVRP